jgi:murein tripeptide amidase MpaA
LIRVYSCLFVAQSFSFAAVQVLTNFEAGNIGKIESLSPVHLRLSVHGQADHDARNRQADWYYFELTKLPKEQITVDLVDLAGEYDYRAPAFSVTKGTRPVYSYDGQQWAHFRDDEVEWEPKEPHLTLRFTPRFNHIWIAHVPPFTNRMAEPRYKGPDLQRQVVGKTVEGRDIVLLTITNRKIPDANKKVIWLMFRQHAWEAGSSWVELGAVQHLLSDKGGFLRDEAIFKILPIADPDGVAAGRVRYNKNGYDLNRNWDLDDPKLMPEIAAQKKAIFDWVDSGHRIDLFLSVHNTESGEYLQAPAEFRALGQRTLDLLTKRTTFNPTVALRETGDAAKGRMTVAQGLYAARKIPAMLMEQMIEYNSKLKRCPTAQDRMEFGAALVDVLYSAVK